MKKILFLLMIATFCSLSGSGQVSASQEANLQFRSTNLPLPRFVSLRSDKVFVRAGPALRYPIVWVFQKEGLPVEIISEYENWRQIRDVDGEEGWVHQSLLSGRRSAIIMNDELVNAFSSSRDDARRIAQIEPRVVADLERCDATFCRLDFAGYRGWVSRKFLWGIYDHEDLN